MRLADRLKREDGTAEMVSRCLSFVRKAKSGGIVAFGAGVGGCRFIGSLGKITLRTGLQHGLTITG